MKICFKCGSVIPVMASVCPACTRDIGGGDSDPMGSLFALLLMGGLVYWYFWLH